MTKPFSDRLALSAAYVGIFFFGVSFLTLGSVLPALKESLGFTQAQSATLAGMLPFGVLVGSAIFGPWCDRFGYRTMFGVASLLVILGLSGMSGFSSLGWLRSCVFAIGMGGGMLNGGTNALVSDVSRPGRNDANIMFLGVVYGIGAILTPVLIGVFNQQPYTSLLRYLAIAVVFCLVYMSFVSYPPAKAKSDYSFKKVWGLVKTPALLIFSSVLFFQSALESLCNNWIPVFLQESPNYGLLPDKSVYVLSFLLIGLTVSRIILYPMMTRISKYTILWITFSIMGLGIVSLIFGLPALPSVFLIGFGLSATFPIFVSSIGQHFKNLSGTAIGIALVIALAGNTLLNYIVAYIPINYFPVYLLAALLCMSVLYKVTLKKVIGDKNEF